VSDFSEWTQTWSFELLSGAKGGFLRDAKHNSPKIAEVGEVGVILSEDAKDRFLRSVISQDKY